MTEESIVIIGLPESGKTTFLAALWHLVRSREVETLLRFGGLRSGEFAHLNAIAGRWCEAKIQDRTSVNGSRLVSMTLTRADGGAVRVTFPDVPGEAYRRMWEERECEEEIVDLLQVKSVLFFVHADKIRAPSWVVDEVALMQQLNLPVTPGEPVDWHPRLAPTQVQALDLIQSLRCPPLDVGPRRLAVMLSAWDKAAEEGLDPVAFLHAKLPLLAQYLTNNADDWDWRVYGVSAQGGDYDPAEDEQEPSRSADELRELDIPSDRILIVGPTHSSHDLTEPLAWLMS